MLRSELDSHLNKLLGSRSGSDAFSDTERVDFLNFALLDAAAIRTWRSMQVFNTDSVKTVAGRVEAELPVNVKQVLGGGAIYMRGALSHVLKYLSPENYHKLYPEPTSYGTGIPSVYTWEGQTTIKFHKVPSVSNIPIHLWLSMYPEPFVTTTDEENPLPRLDRALIYLAAAYGEDHKDDLERAGYLRRIGNRILFRQARAESDVKDRDGGYASVRLRSSESGNRLEVEPLGIGTTLRTTNVG